jgi:hypothetical protein
MASALYEWKDGVVNEKLHINSYRVPNKQLRDRVRQPFTTINGTVLGSVEHLIQERLDVLAKVRCVHEVLKGVVSDMIWFVSEYRWADYRARNHGRCQRM